MAEFKVRDAGADQRMADAPSLWAYLPRILVYPLTGQQCERRRNASLIHAQGARLISMLLDRRRAERALDIYETCLDADRRFEPEESAQLPALAEAALVAKRDQLFERLVADADRRYPGDPTAVSLNFLAARYWYDRRQSEDRARQILRPLLKATQHPQYRQIAAYARALSLSPPTGNP